MNTHHACREIAEIETSLGIELENDKWIVSAI